LVPSTVAQLVKHGLQVLVETGAGVNAGFGDDQYQDQGAEIVGGRAELLEQAEVVTKVRTAGADPEGFASELELMRPGQVVIGQCDPLVGLDWQKIVKYGFSALVAGGGIWYVAATGIEPISIVLLLCSLLIAGLLLLKSGRFPGMTALKVVTALVAVGLGVVVVMSPENTPLFMVLAAVAGLLGVILTLSIGGADMPVVIALLNSYSGLAAAATGFVIDNTVLIIAGSLVGASGLILTNIMCKAMNRSLSSVLFGTLGPSTDTPDADDVYRTVKSAAAEEVAMVLDGAQKVVIVPGYGMAVAQAQHAVRDLANQLTARGIEVAYAIHPVAGRMPGHMNVLLAEADVSYESLKEMDDTNAEMSQVDVAIVLGANDVVNPVARTDPGSPIAGMPIIDVDKARTVVVIKRSLSPGFAGIPNPLFAADNTMMYFGDGKKAVLDLLGAVKEAA
jgi:NAD(P) transhydrogenase subunit beta